MSQIVFSHASLSDLTIEKGRTYPVNRSIDVNQKRYLTESMNPKVISYSSTAEFIILEINGLSKDNYDGTTNGLKTWFSDSNINWSENNFTMTDELNEAHTVRYWQDDFDMPEISHNNYTIKITLLKEV